MEALCYLCRRDGNERLCSWDSSGSSTGSAAAHAARSSRTRWCPPFHGVTCDHRTDWYAREYRAGYADGARAYATRLEGRFGAYTEGVQTNG